MKYLPFFLALLLILSPTLASAQFGNFVNCEGASCSACNFVDLANNLIRWLFGAVFVIFAVLMAVAGFGLVTSGGNQSALDAAKSKFQNAIVGIIIIMAAWLIVDTVMKGLLAGGTGNLGSTYTGFGPWAEVQCQVQTAAIRYIPTVSGPSLFATTTPSTLGTTTPPVSGSPTDRIAAALASMRGMSTAAGPANGALACAWAVNRVLTQAGLAPINGDSVVSKQSQLNGGRGQALPQNQARAGDLVLVTGARTSGGSTNANHVGICQNDGCTSVLSNSSSRRAFVWTSTPNFAPSYINATPVFYRVNN
jgi:hypothetical protein